MATFLCSGMELELTPGRVKRIKSSLEETKKLLAKELSFPEELRNIEQTEFYIGHIKKLTGWVDLSQAKK
jgi:hypothetical protein